MIRSVPNTDRVAAPWAPVGRELEWVRHAAAAVLRAALRHLRRGTGAPELRMSREWLEEYERRSRKRSGEA
jgi:hypothetical protein